MTALEIVGRDEELAVVAGFLADTDSLPRVLIIEGEPGIGKTTVWRHTIEQGQAVGYRVLTTQAGRSEAQLAFAGLSDLLEDSLDDLLPVLPPPQARALRVALVLDDPDPRPADSRAVAAAVLGSLRHLARQGALLVAIDDVQWLDRSSAAALGFALRRLTDEPVAIGVAMRTDEASAPPNSATAGVDEERTMRLRLGPLTLGALHRMLVHRLGLRLPRPALRRVTEVSGGNPFFALELGRVLQQHGHQPGLHDPVPVPDSLAGLLGGRFTALPAETQDALLLAALASEPTVSLVAEALRTDGWAQLRPALDREVITFDGERVCFSHPLLASSVEAEADLDRRRRAHARLATVVSDPIARARHLAHSCDAPDAKIAVVLADASEQAAARGASADAAELADHARRLTPADDPDAAFARLVDSARKRVSAGEAQRAAALLRDAIERLPAGPARGRALLELARAAPDSDGDPQTLRRALDEATGDDALLAEAHMDLALSVRLSEGVERAEGYAREAVRIAERLDDAATLARTLAALSLLRFNAGRGIDDDLYRRLPALERAAGPRDLERSRFAVAHQLVWGGRLEDARSLLEELRDDLRTREDILEGEALWYLTFVELAAGRWALAEHYSEQCELLHEQAGWDSDSSMLWCRATVTAHRGEVRAARRYAERGIEAAEASGTHSFAANQSGVLGFLALSQGDADTAHAYLSRWNGVWSTLAIREPGMWLYGPDLVEACVAAGVPGEAAAALEPYEERARILGRTHVLATARRCRALIAAADGDLAAASAEIDRALAEHARSAQEPFQQARTYLVLGSIERRRRHRRTARAALERALAEFERLGAALWAGKARAELARIGGRAPSRGALTPSELKVAELVAEGLATKEVAARLFVSPRTVDGHLAHIYAKLGVRSRTDLARRLARSAD